MACVSVPLHLVVLSAFLVLYLWELIAGEWEIRCKESEGRKERRKMFCVSCCCVVIRVAEGLFLCQWLCATWQTNVLSAMQSRVKQLSNICLCAHLEICHIHFVTLLLFVRFCLCTFDIQQKIAIFACDVSWAQRPGLREGEKKIIIFSIFLSMAVISLLLFFFWFSICRRTGENRKEWDNN